MIKKTVYSLLCGNIMNIPSEKQIKFRNNFHCLIDKLSPPVSRFLQLTRERPSGRGRQERMSKTRVAIPFSQRGPIPIHLEDSYTGSPTGCSVIDVIFPQGEEISEVRFRWGK